ncbi:MAG: hypothetical protein RBR87_10370 [Bacteroidales bacterium]|nr:hypothetical protein [Bacteroidales bacterium]
MEKCAKQRQSHTFVPGRLVGRNITHTMRTKSEQMAALCQLVDGINPPKPGIIATKITLAQPSK